MQLRDGTDHLLDPDGIESADLDALKKKVLIAVRDMISADVKVSGLVDLRFRIDAEDQGGVIVYTLAFAEALQIIPDNKHQQDRYASKPDQLKIPTSRPAA
jgi:hypothetical protein